MSGLPFPPSAAARRPRVLSLSFCRKFYKTSDCRSRFCLRSRFIRWNKQKVSLDPPLPGAKGAAEWARRMLPQVRAEAKALNPAGIAALLQTAEQLFQKYDYPGVIQLLDVNYMSPEQLSSGFPLDHRSDIFQLGAMLYEMLSGQPPFSSGTVASTIDRVLSDDLVSLRSRNLAVPASVESIILKMLEKNPMKRYQSAVELEIDLKKVLKVAGQDRVICRDADPRATGWGGALEGMFADRS